MAFAVGETGASLKIVSNKNIFKKIEKEMKKKEKKSNHPATFSFNI